MCLVKSCNYKAYYNNLVTFLEENSREEFRVHYEE